MDAKTYSDFALLTATNLGRDLDTRHALMGLQGEIGELTDIFKKHIFYRRELDITHVIEEVGDVFWYLNLLACRNDVDFVDAVEEALIAEYEDRNTSAFTALLCAGTCIASLTSMLVFRDYEGDYDADAYISCLAGTLKTVLHLVGSTVEEAFQINNAKLAARYPDLKFDADKANNRDLAAEKEAIAKVQ